MSSISVQLREWRYARRVTTASFCLVALLASATGLRSAPVALTDDDLKKIVPGATIAIDTPLGASLPIVFGHDGLMTGKAGMLEPFLGAAKDRGRWWIERGRLCQKWFRWFDAEARCVALSQDGQVFHWRQDSGRTGTAKMIAKLEPVVAKEEPVVAAVEPAPTLAEPRTSKVAPSRTPTPGSVTMASTAPRPAMPARTAAPPARPPRGVATPARNAASPDVRSGGARAPARPYAVAGVAMPTRNPIALAREIAARPVVGEATSSARSATGMVPGRTFRVRGVMRDDTLNVRSGPSQEHGVVGVLPPDGRRIRLAGQCVSEWCMVRAGRILGWVNIGFLAPERIASDDRRSWTRSTLGGLN